MKQRINFVMYSPILSSVTILIVLFAENYVNKRNKESLNIYEVIKYCSSMIESSYHKGHRAVL